jgi:hypothetical protein
MTKFSKIKRLSILLGIISQPSVSSEDVIFMNGFEACPLNTTLNYDLSLGIPYWLQTYQDAEYWSLNSDQTLGMVISKPSDDGTVPDGMFTTAGISSTCSLNGDFDIAIDYEWQNIITPTFTGETGTDLWLDFIDTGEVARVLNYASYNGNHYTNVCDSSSCPGSIFGILSGVLKATRVGSQVTFYSTDTNSMVVPIASFNGTSYEGRVNFTIRGRQGGSSVEPRDAMEVNYLNLFIQADQLTY